MKLVILDRDGVINQDSDAFVKNPAEWRPIAGSIDAIAKLYKNGFTIFVTTNQSGLARGLFTLEELNAIHAKMHAMVNAAGGKIERVFYCPHGPDDGCDCRKPRLGLLDQVEEYCGVSLLGVHCIGDSLRDLQAADAKGCQPVLVLTGNGEKTRQQLQGQELPVFADLAAAAGAIIQHKADSTDF
ncbi:MAG: D-glycero-beta-D-manno-heptose 1,7-bisphosphate 7-phosphatase [Pseudomonadales bacterium]